MISPEDMTRIEADEVNVAMDEAERWFFIARVAQPWGRPTIVGCAIRGRDRAEKQRRRLANTGSLYVMLEVADK